MYEEYYSRLGLPNGASKEEVKRAYRQLVKSIHPDVNPAPDANRQFIAITEAYDALMADRSTEFKALDNFFNTPAPKAPKSRPDRKERYRQAMHEQQKIKNQQEIQRRRDMETMVGIYQYIIPFLMVFAFIIMLDMQLDIKKQNDTVQRIEYLNYEYPHTYRVDFYKHESIYLPHFPGKSMINKNVQIHRTAIFALPIGVLWAREYEDDRFYSVRNNVIPIIRFLSFFVFILGILFFYIRSVSFRFNVFIYLFFGAVVLVVFLLYHGNH